MSTKAVPADAFLVGTLVYLRRPDVERDVLQGHWHEWFNDQTTTLYLEHGVFPIDRERQADFVRGELANPSSLLLAIIDRRDDAHVGIVSLKSINLLQRRAEIAIVMGRDVSPGAALEAMALMTKHGFDRVGLNKIYAGQHESLWKWVNTLATIGYRIEGLREGYGYRNGKPWSALITGIQADEFYALQAQRGGDILGGDPRALALSRSKKNKVVALRALLGQLGAAE